MAKITFEIIGAPSNGMGMVNILICFNTELSNVLYMGVVLFLHKNNDVWVGIGQYLKLHIHTTQLS